MSRHIESKTCTCNKNPPKCEVCQYWDRCYIKLEEILNAVKEIFKEK